MPVLPTTAAIAPNAPIGASHRIIAEDAEHERLDLPDRAHDRRALRAHLLQREADEQRDEQHLQDVAGRRATKQ